MTFYSPYWKSKRTPHIHGMCIYRYCIQQSRKWIEQTEWEKMCTMKREKKFLAIKCGKRKNEWMRKNEKSLANEKSYKTEMNYICIWCWTEKMFKHNSKDKYISALGASQREEIIINNSVRTKVIKITKKRTEWKMHANFNSDAREERVLGQQIHRPTSESELSWMIWSFGMRTKWKQNNNFGSCSFFSSLFWLIFVCYWLKSLSST